jgi:hypothetical protein
MLGKRALGYVSLDVETAWNMTGRVEIWLQHVRFDYVVSTRMRSVWCSHCARHISRQLRRFPLFLVLYGFRFFFAF